MINDIIISGIRVMLKSSVVLRMEQNSSGLSLLEMMIEVCHLLGDYKENLSSVDNV